MPIPVQKCDYPVLVIGLGGTGKDAVIAIKKKFQERLICDPRTRKPRRTAFLVLDADDSKCGAGREIETGEYLNLTVNNLDTLLAPENRHLLNQSMYDWLNPNLTPDAITVGAGGIRQIGRFQLFQHVDEIEASFKAALNGISTINSAAGNPIMKADVIICGGLCGGTGSGTFLDMAYLVKKWAAQCIAGFDIKTYGFFTLPDVYLGDSNIDIHDNEKKKLMQANAYACLKELDYWMNTYESQNKMRFTQAYSGNNNVEWRDPPFNLAFLLDKRRLNGGIIDYPYQKVIDNITEMMLYCYAENSAQTFPFDSFMSNVSMSLLSINLGPGREMPNHYCFASLGVSSTEEVESAVSSLETAKSIDAVLQVPIVEENGQAAQLMPGMTGNRYFDWDKNSKGFFHELIGPSLDFTHYNTEDEARKGWLEQEYTSFRGNNKYKAPDREWETIRDAQGTLFTTNILSYAGNENTEKSWAFNAKQTCIELFNAVLNQFRVLTKACIQDAHIGPVSYLSFLREKVLPFFEASVALCDGKVTMGRHDFGNEESSAERISTRVKRNTKNVISLDNANELLHKEDTITKYKKHETDAANSKRTEMWYTQRKASLQGVYDYINQYTNALAYIVDCLEALRNDSEQALRNFSQNETMNQLITLESLRNYFDHHANTDAAVANAKTSINQLIANVSFDEAFFTRTIAGATETDLLRDRIKLLERMKGFLDSVNTALGMGSLDWMVSAACPQMNQANQINYVTNNICQTLDDAAEVMLPYSRPTKTADLVSEHRYLTVPTGASIILQGFQQYSNQTNNIGINQSQLDDRVLWLRVRAGMTAANVMQMEDLQKMYEDRLAQHDALSAGIHLYEKIPEKTIHNANWNDRFSWYLLPDLLPYELMDEGKLSDREKKNWEDAQAVFKKADEAGLINWQPGCFSIAFMKDNLNTEAFKEMVNQIVNNPGQTFEQRLSELEAKRDEWMAPSQTVSFTQFEQRTYDLCEIVKPDSDASAAEQALYQQQCADARVKLGSYLIRMLPNYLKRLQNQLTNMTTYTEAQANLTKEIEKSNVLYGMYKDYARIIASGGIEYDEGVFVLHCSNGETQDLFGLDFAKLGFGSLEGYEKKVITKYWEACFLLQLTSEQPNMSNDIRNKLNFELPLYAGSMRDFKRKAPELFTRYKGTLDSVTDRFNQYVGIAGRVMSEIDSEADLQSQTTMDRLKLPYQAMLQTLTNDNAI